MTDSPLDQAAVAVDVEVEAGSPPGVVEVAVIPNAVGVGGAVWKFRESVQLVAVVATLATSAAVAARTPVLNIKTSNGDLIATHPTNIGVNNNLTAVCAWSHSGGGTSSTGRPAGGLINAPLPPESTVQVTADLADAADAWNTMTISYIRV
jgi:hypothetical protein